MDAVKITCPIGGQTVKTTFYVGGCFCGDRLGAQKAANGTPYVSILLQYNDTGTFYPTNKMPVPVAVTAQWQIQVTNAPSGSHVSVYARLHTSADPASMPINADYKVPITIDDNGTNPVTCAAPSAADCATACAN